MKKYILLSLFSLSLLNSMEQKHKPGEWDAQYYAQGNNLQETISLELLEEYKIDLLDKDIIDAGCGTGNISAIMKQTAKSVHGFDASEDMIKYAQETYKNIPNLTFEHCSAENFTISNQHDLLTSFFCLHWVDNKEAAFQKIYESLKPNGEFIGTIATTSNQPPISIQVRDDMLPWLKTITSFLKNIGLFEQTGRSEIADDLLLDMLKTTGFTTVSLQKQTKNYVFKNRDEVIAFQRPVIMSRPFVQHIPESFREYLFDKFIDKCIEKLEKTDAGYVEPVDFTVIHCRK